MPGGRKPPWPQAPSEELQLFTPSGILEKLPSLETRNNKDSHITHYHQPPVYKTEILSDLIYLMYCWCRHLRQSPGLWSPALLPWPHLLVSPCPSSTPAQGIIINIITKNYHYHYYYFRRVLAWVLGPGAVWWSSRTSYTWQMASLCPCPDPGQYAGVGT